MFKKNELKERYNNMKVGDIIVINTINGSVNAVNYLRQLILDKKLLPVSTEITKVVKPEYIEDYINGTRIFPIMDYVKCK